MRGSAFACLLFASLPAGAQVSIQAPAKPIEAIALPQAASVQGSAALAPFQISSIPLRPARASRRPGALKTLQGIAQGKSRQAAAIRARFDQFLFGKSAPGGGEALGWAALPPSLLSPSGEGTSLGIYTGSFDPPTRLHLAIVRRSLKECRLDKVLIVMNADGEKRFKASLEERTAMLRAGLSGAIDKIDILWAFGVPGFAVALKDLAVLGGRSVSFIMGQDAFEKVPPKVVSRPDAAWIAFRRGDAPFPPAPAGGRVSLQTIDDPLGTSSTKAREDLREGRGAGKWVEPAVEGVIRSEGLYAPQESRRSAHGQAFERFLKALKARHPEFDWTGIEAPAFEAQQSPGARDEDFLKKVLERLGLKGAAASDLWREGRAILAGSI
jgi:nicotinic acid mononucleotide adenylyltransferase